MMKNPFTAARARLELSARGLRGPQGDTRANLLMLTLFSVVLAAVLGAFVVTNQKWNRLRDRQASVDEQFIEAAKQIEELKKLESHRASMMEKAEITAALIEKVPRWALLAEIALRMKDDMMLSDVQLKSKRLDPPVTPKAPPPPVKSLAGKSAAAGKQAANAPKTDEKPKVSAPKFDYTLTIKGAAKRNNDIADFLTSLKDSPVLTRVELTFIREQKRSDQELREFEITAVVRADAPGQALADSLRGLSSQWAQREEQKKNAAANRQRQNTADANAAGGEVLK